MNLGAIVVLAAGIFLHTATAFALPACPAGHACVTVTSTALDLGGNAPGCSLYEAQGALENQSDFFGCHFPAGADTILLPAGEFSYQECLTVIDQTIIGSGIGNTILWNDGLVCPSSIFTSGTTKLAQMTIQWRFSSSAQSAFGAINNDDAGTLTLDHVDITGFNAGGIYTAGTMDLKFSTVEKNTSTSNGGGVIVDGFNGLVTIDNSTISNNSAPAGGGIFLKSGELFLNYSTIANNKATAGHGGGFFANGTEFSLVEAVHDTIAFNTATQSGAGVFIARSSGSFVTQAQARWNSSIIARNTVGSRTDDFVGIMRSDPNDCPQVGLNKNIITVLSNPAPIGWNVVNTAHNGPNNTACTPTAGIGDRVIDPKFLGGLSNHGGPTSTVALTLNGRNGGGSPAINAGTNKAAFDVPHFATDQRGSGHAAPLGNLYDLGAFEAQ